MVNIPTIDWSRFPLKPGNPARASSESWGNWFSYTREEIPEIRRIGEEDYLDEWREVGESGLVDIAVAAKNVGILDVNARLNEALGKVAAHIISRIPGNYVEILDIGCGNGNTIRSIYNNLENSDKKRVRFVGIDLSMKFLVGGENEPGYIRRLEDVEVDVSFHHGSDLEHLPNTPDEAYDLVVGVASLHQHGDLEAPFSEIYRVTKDGGFLLLGDWHVFSNWKHPASMRKNLLERMPFEGKEQLLDEFDAAYPLSKDQPPKGNCTEERTDREIADFWIEYASVIKRGEPRPQFRFHEGHRPAEDYLETMENVGYYTGGIRGIVHNYIVSNPFYLRPDSKLNALTLGCK